MEFNFDEKYKLEFNKLINEFKKFKKNIIIKEKDKNIKEFKIVNSKKYSKKTLYIENLKIILNQIDSNFDLKFYLNMLIEHGENNNFQIKKEIKKYLFYIFLRYYKYQNYNVNIETIKTLYYIKIDKLMYFYDLKSGKFVNNINLAKLIYIYYNFFDVITLNNKNIETIIKKYKKINKNNLNEKINLLIEKKDKLFLIYNKKNILFYIPDEEKILDFDINFNKIKINKSNLKLLLKKTNIKNKYYQIRYYKKGPFDIIEYFNEIYSFLNGEKINENLFIGYYKKKKCYYFESNDNFLELYDKNGKIKTIELNQEENKNNMFNYIYYDEIIEIKNNTNINIKKYDYELKDRYNKNAIIDKKINKKFDIIYENYDFNLIGIILNSEFFILKKNSELLNDKNINAIYKKLINNRDSLIKENNKCNMLFNF